MDPATITILKAAGATLGLMVSIPFLGMMLKAMRVFGALETTVTSLDTAVKSLTTTLTTLSGEVNGLREQHGERLATVETEVKNLGRRSTDHPPLNFPPRPA